MFQKVKNNVWKFYFNHFGSYAYLLQLDDENVLIDTSSRLNRTELKKDLEELGIHLSKINVVILTHSHFDHTGNIEIFTDAKIYGNKDDFKSKKILDIEKLKLKDVKIIKTPGHTIGSICVLYQELLFSGDTLFHRGTVGRTDLLTSSPEDMNNSLEKLKELNYEILCPGHGYE